MGRKNDSDVKPIAIEFFQNKGFHVTQIAEGNFESVDLLVAIESFTCLVEIKEKLDSQERNEPSHGSGSVEVERIERKNKYSRIVDKAVSQLTDSAMPKVDFNVIWFEFKYGDIQTHIHQIIHSLFGIRLGIPVSSGKPRLVYFSTNSDFWKHRDVLNGVIVSHNGDQVLVVNPKHKSFEKFIEFSKHVTLKLYGHDLQSAETQGEIFIADFAIERRFETDISGALAVKYGFEAMFLMPFSKIGVKG